MYSNIYIVPYISTIVRLYEALIVQKQPPRSSEYYVTVVHSREVPVPWWTFDGWWEIPDAAAACAGGGGWTRPPGPRGLTNPWIGFPCMGLAWIERDGTIPGKGIPLVCTSWEAEEEMEDAGTAVLGWPGTELLPCMEPLRCCDIIGIRWRRERIKVVVRRGLMFPEDRRHRIHFGRCSPLIVSILVQLSPNMSLRERIHREIWRIRKDNIRRMSSIVTVFLISERYSASKYKEWSRVVILMQRNTSSFYFARNSYIPSIPLL